MKIKVILLACAVSLSGCASQQVNVDRQVLIDEQIKNNKEIKEALIKAVSETSAALTNLSKIRRSQFPKLDKMPFANIKDKKLNTNISVNWYGPVDSVTRSIANAVNYKYQEYGKKPDLPILVNLNYKSSTALQALQNVELQSNNKAVIKILPKQKIISLRYINYD